MGYDEGSIKTGNAGARLACGIVEPISWIDLLGIYIRDCPRFFDQVGHQTIYACIENKCFFTKSCHCQTYQNYEQPPQSLQNLYFQSHFLASKIKGIFLIFFSSVKNIRLGDQLLLMNFFWKLKYFVFWKCAQFFSPLFIILVGLTMTWYCEKCLFGIDG